MTLKLQNRADGQLWSMGKFLIFFGNKNSKVEALQSEFSKINFSQIKQVHGNNAVESHGPSLEPLPEADGHFTKYKNLALVIKTADCIPIFVVDPKNGSCAGIHAGWRGVASEVLKKTLQQLTLVNGSVPKDLIFFIGPHIQKHSFEVENEFREKILSTIKDNSDCYTDLLNGKSRIDLNLTIRRQIIDFGCLPLNIFGDKIDTMTNQTYCSYRRDNVNAGRQNSFVALNETNI